MTSSIRRAIPVSLALSILGLNLSGLGSWAVAQTVYRCDNRYSQQPCPGGSVMDLNDKRTPEQRREHDERVRQDKRTADALEKSRLKEEAATARATAQANQAAQRAQAQAQAQAKKAEKQGAEPVRHRHRHIKDQLPSYRAPSVPAAPSSSTTQPASTARP